MKKRRKGRGHPSFEGPHYNQSNTTICERFTLIDLSERERRASFDRSSSSAKMVPIVTSIALMAMLAFTLMTTTATTAQRPDSGIHYEPTTGAYSGLTFSFDPKLDKQQVERLHFEQWHSIMHQASSLLYESLNGRAHLAEVRVLIPYKWRHFEWPVLHKPGSPIIANRRLSYSDSDVIVGLEGK